MERNFIRGVRLNELPPAGSYLHGLPVVRSLAAMGTLPLTRPVTFLVGENGTGKSTLLEAVALAAGFNAEGGSRNFQFSTAHTESELYRYIILIKSDYPRDGYFLRAESFYNTASYLDELNRQDGGALSSYGGVSLHQQSHGESFLSLVTNRFGGEGLYLLDEPEAALSPSRQLSLLVAIHELTAKHSQFLIATHSPILMAYPGGEVLELSGAGIHSVDYRETDHYQLTRRFLENPERMLHYLLEEA